MDAMEFIPLKIGESDINAMEFIPLKIGEDDMDAMRLNIIIPPTPEGELGISFVSYFVFVQSEKHRAYHS